MTRRLTSILLSLSALIVLCAVPPAAPAATQRVAKLPEITRVTPMRVSVGARLTIRGKNFSAKRRRNTVVFRGAGGRSAFAKPTRASRRKLVVKVPIAIAKMLGGKAKRFRLRVLTRRFGPFTKKRLSPVIVSSTSASGPGSQSSCIAGDFDGDLLPGSLELSINTDPCLADTDGDGVEDGYEQQSAVDLNHYPVSAPLPYPGKRPYPNALDPSDATTDYDGDVLKLREEFLLWVRFSADGVRRSGQPSTLSNLLYSDGLQHSAAIPAPPGGSLLNWVLDQNHDGALADDERDGDGDGIANWDETVGQFTESWWPAIHDGNHEPKESKYPSIDFLDSEDLPVNDGLADPDLDGDGVLDGADDHDHDGLSNQFELVRPADWDSDAWIDVSDDEDDKDIFAAGPNPWAYTNPFNPCKPFKSARCHSHPPIGYYDSDERPFEGPYPPAGYPQVHPTTPDG